MTSNRIWAHTAAECITMECLNGIFLSKCNRLSIKHDSDSMLTNFSSSLIETGSFFEVN